MKQSNKQQFNWIIPTTLWGMAERGFIILLLGWGVIYLLPTSTNVFDVNHSYAFIREFFTGFGLWSGKVAVTLYGLWSVALAVFQGLALSRDRRRMRRIGMFVLMLNFLAQSISFLFANIMDGAIGQGFWSYLVFAFFAGVSWLMMGAYWRDDSVPGDKA